MFSNKEPITVNESEVMANALTDLKGESETYKGFIEQTIADLKTVNSLAFGKQKKTEALIADLTAVRDEYIALIESNKKTISELEKVFAHTEDEQMTEEN